MGSGEWGIGNWELGIGNGEWGIGYENLISQNTIIFPYSLLPTPHSPLWGT
ncbi:MAG: hypothetical protein KME64_43735 [Scytonematopsis contorta HA4267-MV1]|nr:hypothetical protein [Scytonematopsis contorta HA4267-MV1]